ncbi:uncharacterized protein LOC120495081 isoform X4 [Xyrichtys novacula]|uniref:Uncharacterized protein LOC120495081 isoform X4 n=1 Tax=Xyrichtys novacula TaxID=13765 RepID=A0AAV1EY55_XYRNO|nr:uncharacterized protein LOC120495081 isoform X4 [Xyrichtys novacula]
MEKDGRRPLLLAPTTKVGRKRKSIEERLETKRRCEQARNQSRINIGSSIERWRKLRQDLGLKTDAETAEFLLNRYYQKNPPKNQLDTPVVKKKSAAESRGSVYYECQVTVGSVSEDEQTLSACSSPLSSDKEMESEEGDGKMRSPVESTPTIKSEIKEEIEIKKESDEEFSISSSSW